MSEPLLKVDNLAKRFGGIVATDDLSLADAPGGLGGWLDGFHRR